jgi:hypothetical protein
MRRYLILLGAIVVVWLFSVVNSRRAREKSPWLKRVDETITILVWVLAIAYGAVFLYWLYTVIF